MTEELTGRNCHLEAQRKARYGRRDWVMWIDKCGMRHAAPKSVESVKAALLATGTQGTFAIYDKNTELPHLINWRIGVNVMRHQQLFGT